MTTDHPQPLVSVDTVPVTVRDGRLCLVTSRRAWEPFAGRYALPGVLLLPGERIADAARRALESKAGIQDTNIVHLAEATVFDNPDRDPRGPTISIVHAAVITGFEPGEDVLATPVSETTGLPFDHDAIVARTAGNLLDALWVDQGLTRALLGSEFTTADAARLTRDLTAAAGRPEADTSNLGRTLARAAYLVKAEARPAGRGRPAAGWSWL